MWYRRLMLTEQITVTIDVGLADALRAELASAGCGLDALVESHLLRAMRLSQADLAPATIFRAWPTVDKGFTTAELMAVADGEFREALMALPGNGSVRSVGKRLAALSGRRVAGRILRRGYKRGELWWMMCKR